MNALTSEGPVDEPVELAGALTIYAVREVHDLLSNELQRRSALFLDLSRVEGCDAVGVQLLCSAGKSAEAAGKPFRIISRSAAVDQACDLIGLAATEL